MAEAGLFAYQALDPQENPIRLLTLLPGQFSDEVYLSMTHENLQNETRTPYECLSYTWGLEAQARGKVYIWQKSPTDSSDVYMSRQFLEVRINLLTALKYIRLPDAPRVIWIDAICINQEDKSEKGREVARMGEIYNKAAQVLVWLGPEDEHTHTALETIERLSAGVVLTWDHRSCNTVPGSDAEAVTQHFNESKITPQHWMSLSKLIQRPWFSRLWIRQEVQLASKVLVRCGYAEIEWEKIEKTIIFVEHRISRAYVKTKDVLFCRSLFRYVGSDSITYTLHRSSLCSYTDHRDLVYANLSTSSAMNALQIKPDYNMTVADVFKDMTCKYIQRFKNLDIVRSCNLLGLPEGFKTFVPHFSKTNPESRLSSVYTHAGSRQTFVDTEGGNIRIKGRFIAKVSNVSKRQKPTATITGSSDNDIDIIKIYHQWEPEGLMTITTYPLGGTLLDAFVMLLSNGFCKETYHMPHLPTVQESKESYLAVVWSRGDVNLVKNPKFRPYISELITDRRSEIFFQTAEGYIGASSAVIQDGDIISVLVGASVPIVLRPVVDHLDAYQVVGPCFLQGVMFGEGLLGPLPAGWSCIIHDNRRWCFREEGSERRTWEDPRLWPLPSHWQDHICDVNDNNGPHDGCCALEHVEAGQLRNRWFFNTQSKERSTDDPRLGVQGLEAGGIVLQSFTLV